MRSRVIQPKLRRVSQSNDPEEQEADRVANAIGGAPGPDFRVTLESGRSLIVALDETSSDILVIYAMSYST